MASKHFGKDGDFHIYAYINWADWALPLSVNLNFLRPWPRFSLSILCATVGFEFWLGHERISKAT